MKATWEPATGQDCGMMILNSESREDRLALNIFLRELKKGSKLKISGITYDGDGAGPCSTSIGWYLEESASPLRVSGAGAQPMTPEYFEAHAWWHKSIGSPKAAKDCREADAEITRLREQADALKRELANMLNRRVDLEYSERFAERRAGIEAAAQWHSAEAVEWDNERGVGAREYAKQHRADAAAIRALADKPTWGEQT